MGGVFKREYIWWNIRKDWMPLRNVRGLLRTQAATSNIPTRNMGCGIGSPNINPIPTKRTFGERYQNGKWKTKQRSMESRSTGFAGGSSSDRLTEEQENEIAENIYDWWISGKSYKQWYAEKFQQLKLDFGEF